MVFVPCKDYVPERLQGFALELARLDPSQPLVHR